MTSNDSATAQDTISEDERASALRAGVSGYVLRALAEVAHRRGASLEALFENRAAVLAADPSEQPCNPAELEALFGRAAELTQDPAFALHCGLHASAASFGLMAPLVTHASTLREGILILMQFHQLLLETAGVRLEERPLIAELRCAFAQTPGPNIVDFVVAGLVRMLQSFGCGQRDIQAVHFAHPRPSHHHAYATAFKGAEQFGQAFSGIVFSRATLDRPHLHHDSDLRGKLLVEAELKLKKAQRPQTCTERVCALMDVLSPAELPDVASAARTLGLSERSLRRRLKEEGTSYRDLTQAAVCNAACSMLRNPALTIQSVAHTLGFSDVPAFYRAFRRWRGLTPVDYRAAFFEIPSGKRLNIRNANGVHHLAGS